MEKKRKREKEMTSLRAVDAWGGGHKEGEREREKEGRKEREKETDRQT